MLETEVQETNQAFILRRQECEQQGHPNAKPYINHATFKTGQNCPDCGATYERPLNPQEIIAYQTKMYPPRTDSTKTN